MLTVSSPTKCTGWEGVTGPGRPERLLGGATVSGVRPGVGRAPGIPRPVLAGPLATAVLPRGVRPREVGDHPQPCSRTGTTTSATRTRTR